MLAAIGASPSSAQSVVDGSDRQFTATELNAVRAILSIPLLDPESAQLRMLKRGVDAGVICGEINAKNRLGGYAGFEIFIANTEQGAVTGSSFAGPATPGTRRAFASMVRLICVD